MALHASVFRASSLYYYIYIYYDNYVLHCIIICYIILYDLPGSFGLTFCFSIIKFKLS